MSQNACFHPSLDSFKACSNHTLCSLYTKEGKERDHPFLQLPIFPLIWKEWRRPKSFYSKEEVLLVLTAIPRSSSINQSVFFLRTATGKGKSVARLLEPLLWCFFHQLWLFLDVSWFFWYWLASNGQEPLRTSGGLLLQHTPRKQMRLLYLVSHF